MAGYTPHSGSISEMGSVPTPQTQSVAASTPIETTMEREPVFTPGASLQIDAQPSQSARLWIEIRCVPMITASPRLDELSPRRNKPPQGGEVNPCPRILGIHNCEDTDPTMDSSKSALLE
ncbi:hypothetical protein PIB30_016426 [Stylosanthes scabra]|uniref:Uncharacterized protein n=1 Tax=Stylosanthes scabra TaxID=79078 RepID=A0ABU6WAC6_9FABA|nr:hypothetical protein [Stylosanthes scabra]